MLLQLEQVATERTILKEKWRDIQRDLVAEVDRRTTTTGTTPRRQSHTTGQEEATSYRISQQTLDIFDPQSRARRLSPSLDPHLNDQPHPHNSILDDLADFYRRFDACLDELHERNEIMDLEAFKQLVIREVQERAEALNKFRERLKVVHGQLFQKFIVDELIEGGLYHKNDDDHRMMGLSSARRRRPNTNEIWNEEWIEIDERLTLNHHDGLDDDPRNAIADKPGEGSEWVVCDF